MADKCPNCGAPLENGICGYCGYTEQKTESSSGDRAHRPRAAANASYQTPEVKVRFVPAVSNKSKITALLLCLFLGVFGAHYFYVGKTGMGVLYLLTAGLCGIGWIVDVILILCGRFKDKNGLPLQS